MRRGRTRGPRGGNALAARGGGGDPRGGVAFHHLGRETKGRQSMKARGVKSSERPLMAPLGCEKLTFKVGGRVVFGLAIRVFTLQRDWEIQAKEVWSLVMVGRIPPTREGS